MNSITANCQIHGSYESRAVEVKGVVIQTSCPTCFDIKVAQLNENRTNEMRADLRLAQMNTLVAQAGIPKRFVHSTLDNFITPTEEHASVLSTARRYLEKIVLGGEEKLVLCGGTGTGKTHLGCAIARAFIERTGRPACYTKASVLCDRIHDEMFRAHVSITAMIPKIINGGLLVLDEVGSVGSNKDFQISVVSEAIDYCINNELPIMLISNLDQEELSAVLGGDRSIDRMSKGIVLLSMVYDSYRRSVV